jgi:hypothetical protein
VPAPNLNDSGYETECLEGRCSRFELVLYILSFFIKKVFVYLLHLFVY